MVDTSRDALCSKHPSTALLQNDCGVDSSITERLFGPTDAARGCKHGVHASMGLSMRYPDPGDCEADADEAPGISIWRAMADKMAAVPGLSL